jgi:hypothetical protein
MPQSKLLKLAQELMKMASEFGINDPDFLAKVVADRAVCEEFFANAQLPLYGVEAVKFFESTEYNIRRDELFLRAVKLGCLWGKAEAKRVLDEQRLIPESARRNHLLFPEPEDQGFTKLVWHMEQWHSYHDTDTRWLLRKDGYRLVRVLR